MSRTLLVIIDWREKYEITESKIKDTFKIEYEVSVNTPSKSLIMICPYTEALKRDLKIINWVKWLGMEIMIMLLVLRKKMGLSY